MIVVELYVSEKCYYLFVPNLTSPSNQNEKKITAILCYLIWEMLANYVDML